jgi:hypothetical protein
VPWIFAEGCGSCITPFARAVFSSQDSGFRMNSHRTCSLASDCINAIRNVVSVHGLDKRWEMGQSVEEAVKRGLITRDEMAGYRMRRDLMSLLSGVKR